jgi:hypothetical protein
MARVDSFRLLCDAGDEDIIFICCFQLLFHNGPRMEFHFYFFKIVLSHVRMISPRSSVLIELVH